jgi:hypothetical protein
LKNTEYNENGFSHGSVPEAEKNKMQIPYKDPAHIKVSWLMDNSPPAFPDESSGRIKTVLSNYSYGITGEFRPRPGTPLPLKYALNNLYHVLEKIKGDLGIFRENA